METWEKNLNALFVVVISAVLLSSLGFQLFKFEEPCPLCLIQRCGMIALATGALLNIKFGIRKSHYALSLLSAFMGGFVALRQIALHVCPGFPRFGIPFLGLSLYTWSFILFTSSVVYISLLLLIFDRREKASADRQRLNWWCRFAFTFIFFVSFSMIVTTFVECGWGPC